MRRSTWHTYCFWLGRVHFCHPLAVHIWWGGCQRVLTYNISGQCDSSWCFSVLSLARKEWGVFLFEAMRNLSCHNVFIVFVLIIIIIIMVIVRVWCKNRWWYKTKQWCIQLLRLPETTCMDREGSPSSPCKCNFSFQTFHIVNFPDRNLTFWYLKIFGYLCTKWAFWLLNLNDWKWINSRLWKENILGKDQCWYIPIVIFHFFLMWNSCRNLSLNIGFSNGDALSIRLCCNAS